MISVKFKTVSETFLRYVKCYNKEDYIRDEDTCLEFKIFPAPDIWQLHVINRLCNKTDKVN